MNRRVLNRALYAWQILTKDPASTEPKTLEVEEWLDTITDYIRDGFGWSIKTQYRGDGSHAWCGAFAAWCYLVTKVSQETRRVMASTWRLYAWGKKNPMRCVATSAIEPGDIVCVGDGDYGSHITIAVAWDARKSELIAIGGNQEGRLPDGTWGEGITMRVYQRTAIKAAYRPPEEE